MTYRVHKEGYIETDRLSFRLPGDSMRASMQVGGTRISGVVREVSRTLGLEIEDAETVMVIPLLEADDYEVRMTSSWKQPSRR